MWFASGADRQWNEFPAYWDFVALVHETIPYLMSFGESRAA